MAFHGKLISVDEACNNCTVPSIQQLHMSFSESSTVPVHHKWTISEHVTENGDPLAIRKKACEAAKNGSVASLAKSKKIIRSEFFFRKDALTFF